MPTPTLSGPDPLAALPDDMLTCRAETHDLQPLGENTIADWSQLLDDHGRVIGRSRVTMCTRCSAIARDVSYRHEYGARKRRWTYPAGYSMPPGQARSKREARVEDEARFYARNDAARAHRTG